MQLLQEFQQTARGLLRQPGLTLLSVLALGLGIGLPTSMFSLVDGAVLRGLPVEQPHEIFHLERRRIGRSGEGFQAHARDYVAWTEQQRSFEKLAAFRTETFTLRSERGADRWSGAYVTPSAFEILNAQPALGRTFNAQDDQAGAAPVVLLGHTIWRDRFGSDPGVLGTVVQVDGRAHTVVGVMPAEFRFPGDDDLWLPLVVGPQQVADERSPSFDVFGRLRDGVSRAQARAEFGVIAAQMAQRYPQTNQNLEITVKRFTERFVGETATTTMYVILGAVLLVLLVACINVANLLLVRAVDRLREIAIRAALGARRGRIVRQLFLESTVLAILGGALGIVIAYIATRFLGSALLADRMPYWSIVRLDGRVLLFALAMSALAALAATLFPAFKTTRGNIALTLYDQSRGSTGLRVGRLMRSLIVLEVAFSLALLVVAGLMIRGVRQVQAVPLGFAPQEIFTARVTLPDSYDPAARVRYFAALRRALEAEPAAASVTLAGSLPTARAAFSRVALDGVTYETNDARPYTRFAEISDAFFTTFGAQILRGRAFGPQDGPAGEPVAIVNSRFVQRHLSGDNPIGQRIRLGNADGDEPWRTIVGIVPDLWIGGLDAMPDRNPAGVYVPLAQSRAGSVSIAIRVRGGQPMDMGGAVRAAAFRLDPDVPLYEIKSMPTVVLDNSWFYGLGVGIMGACGLAALLLATIGLYGVIAFSVTRRTREFGIRMAVGASPARVIRLVLRQTGGLAVGLALGLALAYVLARGVSSLLFQVSPGDPLVFAGVTLLLAFIGLTATLIPALRAAHVDPLTALRTE
jgi:predicted permease